MSLRRGIIAGWCPSLGPTAGTLLDRFAGRNHGRLTNMSIPSCWAISGGKYALDFDGSNDYMQLSNPISLDGDFFFAGWFYLRSTSTQLFWTNSNSGLTTFFLNTSTTVSFRTQSSSLITFTVSAFNDKWVNLILTRKGSSVRLFVDGTESSSGALTAAGTVIADRIGASFQGLFPLNGLIDDFLFSAIAASESSVGKLKQIGRGGIYKPRRRRRAYSSGPKGLRRKLLLTGQV